MQLNMFSAEVIGCIFLLSQQINSILHVNSIGLDKQKNLSVKMLIFSYSSVLTEFLGAQKNSFIETILLGTHNICFDWEIRKLFF